MGDVILHNTNFYLDLGFFIDTSNSQVSIFTNIVTFAIDCRFYGSSQTVSTGDVHRHHQARYGLPLSLHLEGGELRGQKYVRSEQSYHDIMMSAGKVIIYLVCFSFFQVSVCLAGVMATPRLSCVHDKTTMTAVDVDV